VIRRYVEPDRATLVDSIKTVETHVGAISTKLGLRPSPMITLSSP
jgi:hypothetical protein